MAQRRRRSSTSPRRFRKRSGRKGFASTASRRAPSRRTWPPSASASNVPTAAQPTSTRTGPAIRALLSTKIGPHRRERVHALRPRTGEQERRFPARTTVGAPDADSVDSLELDLWDRCNGHAAHRWRPGCPSRPWAPEASPWRWSRRRLISSHPKLHDHRCATSRRRFG